jgi:cytochrome c peroxidase
MGFVRPYFQHRLQTQGTAVFRWTAILLIAGLLGSLWTSCGKRDQAGTPPGPVYPYNPTPLSVILPNGWPAPAINIFAGNAPTEEGFQLGRRLFYDGRLSRDGNFPCASCHQQFAAFATFDHQFSHGFDNTFTNRNAPGLFNLAWLRELHMDGGIPDFISQPASPITAINEMAETVDNVLRKLRADTMYHRLFTAAFGDTSITYQRLASALTQFVGTLLSNNSKYDQVQRGQRSFDPAEQAGLQVFRSKCATCHPEPLFTDLQYHNIGLALDPILNDPGRMLITGNASDSLKFRTPSLRNVVVTFPYMHDGRLFTLTQVVEHYRSGIITNQPTLSPSLRSRIPISNQERVDLIAFLQTLTDSVLLANPRFAQP